MCLILLLSEITLFKIFDSRLVELLILIAVEIAYGLSKWLHLKMSQYCLFSFI